MKVELWVIGKTELDWIKTGLNDYLKRIPNYISFKYDEINVRRKDTRMQVIVQDEAAVVLKKLKAGDVLVLLDEHGIQLRSDKFADWLQKQLQSPPRLIFLIGGAYGFDQSLRDKANAILSLSAMTFTHQMVRVIFAEQLYRALTIIRNESYHH